MRNLVCVEGHLEIVRVFQCTEGPHIVRGPTVLENNARVSYPSPEGLKTEWGCSLVLDVKEFLALGSG